jgi:proline dehydrogenase
MPASNDAMREIAKALRRDVDAATLENFVNELLDVRGNRDFREAIEELARELMRR